MSQPDPDEIRQRMAGHWERAAEGWEKHADRFRDWTMPLTAWMIEHLQLQPGQTVLELAAGPGDTGFLAAEQIAPGGTLISSDANQAMLDLARRRAEAQGVTNVEFKQLELEWLDLPTAAVDAILCRWGVMLVVDPESALRECRRVLRPGGRCVLAVWDRIETNPWTGILVGTLVELGHFEPAGPGQPGMFALAGPGLLEDRLADAGFTGIRVESVDMTRRYDTVDDWLGEALDVSTQVAQVWGNLDEAQRREVRGRLQEQAARFADAQGRLTFPARSLAGAADA